MNRNQILRATDYLAFMIIGSAITLAAMPAYEYVTAITIGRHVQTLSSGSRTAVLLKKYNLADFNFIVQVDGTQVYASPDLYGVGDHSLRETLVWDKSGHVVVLELMGKRVFAYDAVHKRVMEKGELAGYEFYPMPDDYFGTYLTDIDEGN